MQLIRKKTDFVFSQLESELSYARWQAAAAELMLSLGHDMIPIYDKQANLKAITEQIKKQDIFPKVNVPRVADEK